MRLVAGIRRGRTIALFQSPNGTFFLIHAIP